MVLAREAGDLAGVGAALRVLSAFEFQNGRYERAWRLREEGLDLGRRHGSSQAVCVGLGLLAHLARVNGDYDSAQRLFEEALALARTSGHSDAQVGARLLWSLGYLAGLGATFPAAGCCSGRP